MNHFYQIKELIFKVENISLKYDNKQILENINFEIHNITRPNLNQGQVVALIGRSGIGKTQLFKILAGLIKPTSGSIHIGVDQHPVKAGDVAVVPQNYILFNHRTVLQNLNLGLRNNPKKVLSAKDKNDLVNQYVEIFNLKEHLQKYPAQLSGGQRQRVSIIQQILTGNQFILLDEPFSGLDILMVDKVIDLLLKVSTLDELNTLILVSHDVQNALAISDTAFILAKGCDGNGATMTEKIDLMKLGFAWEPEIRKNREFQELVASIKDKI